MIKTISSREVYRNPWTSVREDVIERANGERGIYGVIDKDPASIIIPLDVTAEGEFVYLIEQFRYTVGGRHWEFPQGGWETAEVVPEELARGELKEETGLTAERMTHLSTLQIAYGVMNQKQHVFLAEGLKMGDGESGCGGERSGGAASECCRVRRDDSGWDDCGQLLGGGVGAVSALAGAALGVLGMGIRYRLSRIR